MHIKHEQPQVLSPDSHVTIGTIQQTHPTELWVWRHNCTHAAWPTDNTDIHGNPLEDTDITNTNLIKW